MRRAGRRKKGKVVVGMSGGVDSSVAAAVLAQAGYDVIGVTFKTWPKEECGTSFGRACCNLESITRARHCAEQLGIPYYVVDFHDEFKREVIDYFTGAYLGGRTPNPCIKCNSAIKFGVLLKKAGELGADHVATGHFARVRYGAARRRFILSEGVDAKKDQSYFLFSLNQEQLASCMFPLGRYTKAEVRLRAKKLRLKAYDAPSSQDICFIQDMTYADYIRKVTGADFHKGEIVDTAGNVIGTHHGICGFTIGQRRGIGIAHSVPLYVVGIDARLNRVVVGERKDTGRRTVFACDANWIVFETPPSRFRAEARIRYNHKKARCLVEISQERSVRVSFDETQDAPTPGQAIVFYRGRDVIGGGWIEGSQ